MVSYEVLCLTICGLELRKIDQHLPPCDWPCRGLSPGFSTDPRNDPPHRLQKAPFPHRLGDRTCLVWARPRHSGYHQRRARTPIKRQHERRRDRVWSHRWSSVGLVAGRGSLQLCKARFKGAKWGRDWREVNRRLQSKQRILVKKPIFVFAGDTRRGRTTSLSCVRPL